MTRVINMSDLPETSKRLVLAGRLAGYVYVGRSVANIGLWGNRYSHKPSKVRGVVRVATVREAVLRFMLDLKSGQDTRFLGWPGAVKAIKSTLHGETLACWCRPKDGFQGELLCHAQILAAICDDIAPEDVL